jgi:hypothetical protein
MMLNCAKHPLSGRANALQAPRPGKRAATRRPAAPGDKSGFNWEDNGAFGVLQARMAALRRREDRAAAFDALLSMLRQTRPILPENVAYPSEEKLDHKLICDW